MTAANVPSTTWRMLAQRTGIVELPKGIDAAWDAAAGYAQRLVPRRQRFLSLAAEVVAMEGELADLSQRVVVDTCGVVGVDAGGEPDRVVLARQGESGLGLGYGPGRADAADHAGLGGAGQDVGRVGAKSPVGKVAVGVD